MEKRQGPKRRFSVSSFKFQVKPETQNRKLETSPARILIVESGSGFGGSSKYLSQLLAGLDRSRYDVRVVATQGGPAMTQIQSLGLPIHIEPLWRFPWGEPIWREADARGRVSMCVDALRAVVLGPVQALIMVPRITVLLRRQRIHIVHLNNEVLSHVMVILAAKLAGCQVVCQLHGWRPFTRLERLMGWAVDVFVCTSQAGLQYYQAQCTGRPLVAIPNGIVLNGRVAQAEAVRLPKRQSYGLQPEDIAVTILGRLVPWKGHQVFLNALATVMRHNSRVVGLIIGHDPSPDQRHLLELKQQAKALGIAGRIKCLPWEDEAWAAFAAADVIVHASTKPEPFGLVIVEAMAAGRPIIATRGGAVTDIIEDGASGLIVEPGDANALSDAIRRLLDDRPLAGRMVEEARQRVRTLFSMERNIQQVCGVYDRLLGASL